MVASHLLTRRPFPYPVHCLLVGAALVGAALWSGCHPASTSTQGKVSAEAASGDAEVDNNGLATRTFPVRLELQPVPLDSTAPGRQQLDSLHFMAGFHLIGDRPEFGGFSGLGCLDEDGLLAISDRGHWLSLELTFDAEGRLIQLDNGQMGPLLDDNSQPVTERERRDAEELAVSPKGGLVVAFEGDHRLVDYDGSGALALTPKPRPFPFPAGISRAGDNSGFEALTLLADGRLLLLTEGLRDDKGMIVGWIGSPTKAPTDRHTGDGSSLLTYDPLRLQPIGPFQPTAATTMPATGPMAGDVLLLQRHYTPETGTRVRLVYLEAADLQPNALLQSHELAYFEAPVTVDNFEGLTACATPEGRTFVYLISDDNFSETQRTLLLQFELTLHPG